MAGNVIPLRSPRGPLDGPLPTRGNTALAEPAQKVTIEIGDDGTDIFIGGRPKPRKRAKQGGFYRNLAEDLDDDALAALAHYIIESVEADEQDRRDWEETANQAAAFLGIKLENPEGSSAEDGTVCKSVATCMLESAMKLWSTAYGELLPAGGPVKVERKDTVPANGVGSAAPGQPGASQPSAAPPSPGIGDNGPPPGQMPGELADPTNTDDLADALEKDLNWYLTKGDRGYYADFSKMLFHRDLIGIQIREVYDCPIQDKPISRWIRAQDFIVKGDPAHLSESTRHTVRKKVAQSVMRRMMVKGYYRDIILVNPTGEVSQTEIVVNESAGISSTPSLPRDYDHVVYQSHCEIGSGTSHELDGPLATLDLDENGRDPGYPLPYIVTVDKDSRTVLRIARAWEKGDKNHRREPRFVKYGFIPGFTFYDFGLIHLVGNPTQSATMLERSCVDAGLFANFPGWLMKQGPASKIEDTVWRLQPGEIKPIPVTGSDKLADAIMAVPYKPPAPESLQMAAALEGKVKAIAGVVEIPVGEGRIGNTPVGTIMSYIESTTMVPGAVHKADHVSMSEEFDMLRKLLARRPKILWQDNPDARRKWQTSAELNSVNLSPASDPNTPSLIHRLLKIQGRVQLAAQPQFQGIPNQRAIYQDAMEALGGEAEKFTLPPQPAPSAPPDPKVIAAQIKTASDQQVQGMKNQAQQAEAAAKLKQAAITSQDKEADRDAANQREAMKMGMQRAKTGADLVKTGADAAHDAQQNQLDRGHEAGLQAQDHAAQHAQQQADHAQQSAAQKADHTAQATQQGAQHAQDTLTAGLGADSEDKT